MQKKYILITGVSSGIGYDAVKYLINKGYFVIGSVRKKEDKERLEKDFKDNFCCLQFDVTKREEIESSFETVKNKLGENHLTGLVNNAGLAIGGPMSLMPDEQFRSQMEVNLFGVRNTTNVFLPLLGAYKEFTGKPGKIINISSLAGVLNTPFNGAYCVSKHAVESLGEIYRRELMLYGIDVISIQAGPIASEIWAKNIGTMDRYADTDFAVMTKKADKLMQWGQRNALPAEAISGLIHKILTIKKPKTSYIVNKNKLFTKLFVKYLPSRMVDRLLWKKMANGNGKTQ